MSSCSTADSGECTNSLCPSATRNSTWFPAEVPLNTVSLMTSPRNSWGSGARTNAMRDSPVFRRTMMVVTLVWGTVLLAKAAISVGSHAIETFDIWRRVDPNAGFGA